MIKTKIKNIVKGNRVFYSLYTYAKGLSYSLRKLNKTIFLHRSGCAIIQLVSTFNKNDAIGTCVKEISRGLNSQGIENYIIADVFNNTTNNFCPLKFFRFKKEDILIFHYGGFNNSVNSYIKVKSSKKILFYHNITPSKYFFDDKNNFALSKKGREYLIKFKQYTDATISVSKYSDDELRKIGYKNRYISPIPNKTNELLKYNINNKFDDEIAFVTVGRIARHKCVLDILKIYHVIKTKYIKNAKLYIIGSIINDNYKEELNVYISKNNIKDCNFLGSIDDKRLSNFYRTATGYICMSEHEGFCVPLIESMAFGLPIFAYESSAIKETLGDAGYSFKNKNYEYIAKFISKKLENKKEIEIMKKIEINRYKTCFNSDICVDNIIKIINKIMLDVNSTTNF